MTAAMLWRHCFFCHTTPQLSRPKFSAGAFSIHYYFLMLLGGLPIPKSISQQQFMQRFWGRQTNKQRKDASGCVTIMGATKIVLLSTLVAVLGFLAFMELQIVTVSFSFESLYIPAAVRCVSNVDGWPRILGESSSFVVSETACLLRAEEAAEIQAITHRCRP